MLPGLKQGESLCGDLPATENEEAAEGVPISRNAYVFVPYFSGGNGRVDDPDG